MPRYLVHRTLQEGLQLPNAREVIERNEEDCVTWLHSYLASDGRTLFCVYEAPTPEAIRRSARRNALPVDRIFQVDVLDPYAYGGP